MRKMSKAFRIGVFIICASAGLSAIDTILTPFFSKYDAIVTTISFVFGLMSGAIFYIESGNWYVRDE